MKYFDKSKNRDVTLSEGQDEMLVILKADEAENVSVPDALLNSGGTVVAISPRVYRIRLPKDAESLLVANMGIRALHDDESVELVASLAQDEEGSDVFVVPNRISVLVRGLTKLKAAKALKDLGYKLEDSGRSRGLYLVTIPQGTDIGDAIGKINAIPEVVLAEPVFVGLDDQELTAGVRISRAPQSDAETLVDGDAPSSTYEWNHDRIRIASAWAKTQGSDRIVIGIVDGSPEMDHEALAGRLITGFVDEMRFAEASGTSSHATNVASIALGSSDCFTGIAPGCRLLPLVVDLTIQEYWRRADAIFYAAERARAGEIKGKPFDRMVLVCSWKMAADISIVRLALTEVVEAGVLVITSAGNSGTDAPHWPSDYSASGGVLGSGVLSVAATDPGDARAFYSNWSDKVDLAAPGGDGPPFDNGDLRCAGLFNSYDRQAGTSLSAPHVAAVAALALSINPKLEVGTLKALLRDTCDAVRTDRPVGSGRLNAARLLDTIYEAGVHDPEPIENEDEDAAPEPDPKPDVTPDTLDQPVPGQDTADAQTKPGDGPKVVITVGKETQAEEPLRSLAEEFRTRTETETDAELLSVVFNTKGGKKRFDFEH